MVDCGIFIFFSCLVGHEGDCIHCVSMYVVYESCAILATIILLYSVYLSIYMYVNESIKKNPDLAFLLVDPSTSRLGQKPTLSNE